ncbi:MAG: M23 family metallopeptidase, partial [Actinomycetes bacterium]
IVVSNGQRVSQGQLIAYSGSTGNSTGCHAHFETWLNGRAVDPMGLL